MRYSAALAWRSPPRLSRWRLVLPEGAGIGFTPHRAANAPASGPPRPERVPAQPRAVSAPANVATLRKRLVELAAEQGFDQDQVRTAVVDRLGKSLDDLTAAELTPLIEGATEKLQQPVVWMLTGRLCQEPLLFCHLRRVHTSLLWLSSLVFCTRLTALLRHVVGFPDLGLLRGLCPTSGIGRRLAYSGSGSLLTCKVWRATMPA